MRRFRVTATLLAISLLCTAGVAYASSQFVQKSNITLTATKAKKPTGFKVNISSEDPGALQPLALKTLTITLPNSTKFNFNSKAIKKCRASDVEIKATGGHACPSKSLIGTGTAVANGKPGVPTPIPENAVAYAGSGQIVVLISPAGPIGQVLVLHAKVSANKVAVSVPALSFGPQPIVLTSLVLSVKTIGGGSNAFITAGNCTNGKFAVKAKFDYQVGASVNASSSSKCSK
jgi:hypothetical protein